MNLKENNINSLPHHIHYKDDNFSIVIRPFNILDALILTRHVDKSLPLLLPFTEWARHEKICESKTAKINRLKAYENRVTQSRYNYATGVQYDFIIEDKDSSRLMMCATLSRGAAANPRSLRLDFWTTAEYCNKGLATLVTKIMAYAAFNYRDCNYLEIWCNKENKAALRVIEKCNFALEGEIRNYFSQPTEEMIQRGVHPERSALLYSLIPETAQKLPWYQEVNKNIHPLFYIRESFWELLRPALKKSTREEPSQDPPTLIQIFLTINIILIGRIAPQLRAVQANVNEKQKRISIRFYFDGEVSSYDEETLRAVCTPIDEIWCAFTTEVSIIRYDYPKSLPDGNYVHLRYEESVKKENYAASIANSYDNNTLSTIENAYALLLCALLGEIRAHLRAVKIALDEQKKFVYLWFYFDGEISEKDREQVVRISGKLNAFLGSEYAEKVYVERLDYPQKIPSLGIYAYLRDELPLKENFSFNCSGELCGLFKTLKGEHFYISDLNSNHTPIIDPLATNLHIFLSRIRFILQGRIRKNLRAIQFDIDSFTKTAYIWMYVDGEIDLHDRSTWYQIYRFLMYAGYRRVGNLQRLDFPAKIPPGGYRVFQRHEIDGAVDSQYLVRYADILYGQVTKEVLLWQNEMSNVAPQTSLSTNLRVAQANFIETINLLYVFFFFDNPANELECERAKLIMTNLRKQFPKSKHEGVVMHIQPKSKIPPYGKVIYCAPGETRMSQLCLENTSLLFQLSYKIQQALNGKITPQLRAVKVDVDELKKVIYLWIYYEKEPSVMEQLFAENVIQCADAWPDFACESEIKCIDNSLIIPNIGRYVYCRNEEDV